MRLSIVSTIFLLALLLTGCTTRKKATNWMTNHPMVLAELCSDKYPVKETFLPGKIIVKTDTLINKVDSIYCPEDKNGNVKMFVCPPSKTIYTTTTIRDTIIKENTAKLAVLTNDLSKVNTLLDKEKERAANWRSRFIWAITLGLMAFIAARAFKF